MALTPEQIASAGTEHAHQAAYFCALPRLANMHPEIRWVHAVANGGERDVITAGKLKAEGVKAGVWDCFVPLPVGRYHGLYIEFKKPTRRRQERGGLSDMQWEFGLAMHRCGYMTAVAYTWEEAIDITRNYLAGQYEGLTSR